MNYNGNGKRTLRERIAEFMCGRNGIDSLYHFIFWIIILLTFISFFVETWVLPTISSLLLIYNIYRVFSKNVYHRQKENQIYLSCLGKIRKTYQRIKRKITGKIALLKNKWNDRHTHIYKKCPKCHNTLRLPKIKGKHTAACPCCDNRFDVKI